MTQKTNIRRMSAVLLASAAIGMLLPVVSANAAEQQIEEITVTARKRKESILKVPVIETALTQQSLERYGTSNLTQLQNQVPGLLMAPGTGAFGLQVSIRGIGTSTLNAAIDQSVSLNVDGMQITQGLAYTAAMFDVAQVEVLKGPQALFYGKASPGGVISLRSNDPTDETEVTLKGGYEFEAAEKTGEFIVSGPLTDTLKARIAAKYSDKDGFFNNTAIGIPALGGATPKYKKYQGERDYEVRGTLLWNPTDKLDFRLKANYAKTLVNGDISGLQYTGCPGGTTPLSFVPIQWMSPTEDCKLNRTIQLTDMTRAAFPAIGHTTPYENLWLSFGSLETNYHPTSDLTVTSVSGYYILRQAAVINGTIAGAAGPSIATDNTFFRRDLSEELRVNSTYDGPFNFTAGFLYHDGYMSEDLNGEMNQAVGLGLPVFFQQGRDQIQINTVSIFAQGRYKILPDLELAVGARWSHEWRDMKEYAQIINGAVLATPYWTPLGKINSYHLNPATTLTYTPTDDLTFFASYKEASKSGSFDTTIIEPAGSNAAFGDEGVKGGEIGMKARLLGGRAMFSTAGYFYKYTNLQVGANQVVNGVVIDKTLNAASAKIYGIEASISYLMDEVPGLMLNGAVNWNHARFDKFNNALCWGGQTIADGCNQGYNSATGLYTAQNLSGRPLLRAPNWSATFGFTYTRPVWDDMTLTIGSNTAFTSGYYANLVERYDSYQRAFFKTNLSISLAAPDDSWEFSVIGNNLNNAITTANCVNGAFKDGIVVGSQFQTTGGTTSGLEGPDGMVCSAQRGREIWLKLTLHPLDLLH